MWAGFYIKLRNMIDLTSKNTSKFALDFKYFGDRI